MKTGTRYLLCFLVATVLSLGAVVAWRLWPRPLPPEECSELYRTYKDTPGVDATFIRDFRVNDTLTLDVTLLQATDSMGWETLISDFQVSKELLSYGIMTRQAQKGHSDRQRDAIPENNDIIMVADGIRTISIFHITDKKQIYPILNRHIKELKDK